MARPGSRSWRVMMRSDLRATRLARYGAVAALALLLVCFLGSSTPCADPLQVPIPLQGTRTLPVVASHGMVVTEDKMATGIGVDILRRGGNAVDAAVAVSLALAVTLPKAGNLGGGGFMLIHLAETKKTIAIDFREMAPAATTTDVFLDAEGRAVAEKSRDTGLAVGVPGTVAGLALALRHYGSGKFGLADLAAPAVALAREGIVVEDDLVDSLPKAAGRLRQWPSSAKIFLNPDGTARERGTRLVQSDLAAVLEKIGAEGERGFYEGPVAEKIVAAVRAAGGRMSLEDMKFYSAIEREPVRGTYRGHEIVSMPPPSSGGVHVIELLNILEGFPPARTEAYAAAELHLLAEAMKLVYADRAEYLGDPDHVAIPVRGLTSKPYAAKLRERISPTSVMPSAEIRPLDPTPYESAETTHFSIVDAAGNAISSTTTLNFSYGLGMVAEGTGLLLNNELDDFAAAPGVPNAYGLVGGAANAPGPRRRPLSSMAPTMVFRDGALELVTGSPGGSRIITIVAKIILDVLDRGMNIAEATEAPRIHHQGRPNELQVERGLSSDTILLLEDTGHKVSVRNAWGSAQSIFLMPGLLLGAADPRHRGTLAAGY